MYGNSSCSTIPPKEFVCIVIREADKKAAHFVVDESSFDCKLSVCWEIPYLRNEIPLSFALRTPSELGKNIAYFALEHW